MRRHPGLVVRDRAAAVEDEAQLREQQKQNAFSEADGIARGAADLLADPAFKAATRRLEAAYLEEWRRSAMADERVREKIFVRIRALDELKADLETAAAAGRLTARNLRLT